MLAVVMIICILLIYFIYYNKNRKNYVICLMYHSVYKNKVNGIISLEEFEKQMEYIKNKKTFKMEELEKLNYKLPKDSILITFDDGYKNNYTNAFPILKKYGLKATIFLNTKYVGNDEYYLNWDEIKEMYESGLIDFQMHTHSHKLTIKKIKVRGFYNKDTSPYYKRESYSLFFEDDYSEEKENKLNNLPILKCVSQISDLGYKLKKEKFLEKYKDIEKVMETMSLKEKKKYLGKILKREKNNFFEKVSREQYEKIVEYEILENKKIIEKKLNKKVDTLAYPWGHRYKGNAKKLKKLGVNIIITTRKGANSLKLNKDFICRISGDDFETIEDFKKELNNGGTPIFRKIFR